MAIYGRRKRQDDSLALALAAGQTLRDAAAAAGIGQRTASRRWSDAAFRRRVSRLRADMVERAAAKMSDGMTAAADVLRELLFAESEAVRLGACRAMLELGVKLRESTELAARIEALEQREEKHEPEKPTGPAGRVLPATGAA